MMNWFRFRHTLGMYLQFSAQGRAEYIRKHELFSHMGKKCMVMFRKLPLYPKLISVGNNVWIASDVMLVTHDVIHRMLNNCVESSRFQENLGCIAIRDNVFIGARTTVLPNVTIGPNTIIAAGSLVNKSIPGNGVYGGVPVKYISSLNEFLDKRKSTERIEIKKDRRGLSEKTVEACWMRFHDLEERRSES